MLEKWGVQTPPFGAPPERHCIWSVISIQSYVQCLVDIF